MAFAALQASPLVGDVGVAATFVPVGSPDGNERRWYLASAPAASALPTVATASDPETARLTVNAAGLGVLTPDAPGAYSVRLDDVRTTLNLPHFSAPNPPPVDPPPVVVGSLTSPSYWVAQTITRLVGSQPNQVTLSVRTYANQVDSLRANAVQLLKPTSTAMRTALSRQEILDLLSDLLVETDLMTTLNVPLAIINQLDEAWNIHAVAGNLAVHSSAGTISVPGALVTGLSADPVVLGASLLSLVSLSTAHFVDAIHPGADYDLANTVIDITTTTWLSSPPTLAELARLCNRLDQSWEHHLTILGPHTQFDGNYGQWIEPTRARGASILATIVRLAKTLVAHQARTSTTVHAHQDLVNIAFLPEPATLVDLYGNLNTLADGINRHVLNQDASGTVLSPSSGWYHYNHASSQPVSGSRLIAKRAHDPLSAVETIDEILLATETHMLDLSLHPSGGLGAIGDILRIEGLNGPGATDWKQSKRYPYVARLRSSLAKSLGAITPVLPDGVNQAAISSILTAGWSAT